VGGGLWKVRRPGGQGAAPRWDTPSADPPPVGPEEWELSAERELRDFLERAVPLLPAPAERIRRVRERARVRRRRQAIGGAAVLVAATALTVTLVPWPAPEGPPTRALTRYQGPRHTEEPSQPSRTGPPARPSGAPSTPAYSAPPSPGAGGGGPAIRAVDAPVRYPDLADLTIRVPRGWQALAVVGPGRGQSAAFAGQQRLAPTRHPCLTREYSCVPVARLEAGRGVIGFRLMRGHFAVAKAEKASELRDARLTRGCRVAGGSRELRGWIVVGDRAPNAAVRVSVCLNEPSAVSMGQVRHVLDSATFGGDAPPAPGSRRD
ncbi:hypothetical protein, partial [Streptomyces palmae]